MVEFTTRLATSGDAGAIADVFSPSFRLPTFLPMLHTEDEDRDFVSNIVLREWCFQANARARRFYERHGFKAVRFTNGQDNEEKMPDVLYRWERG